jgi:ATP-dependent protease HslVU (ClpYQ) peptidase subunit
VTVIAWDGKTLAADRMMGFGSSKSTVTKIFKVDGMLFGFAGHAATGSALANWVRLGRNPDDFPSAQRGSEYSGSLLLIEPDGVILHYSTEPYPMIVEDSFYAVGSGDEFALAAMFLGKTAREAVEVACALCPTCGNGIDTLELA